MHKALRRAAWGLTAGLVLASPVVAQYAAHRPGSSAPLIPQTTIVASTPAVTTATPIPTMVPASGQGSYYTPDVPKGYVLQPVSHTTTVTAVTGLPTGYILQAVDGEPVTKPVLDSHTKLEEMKVELALLSDPATFGCGLKANLDGAGMLVRGYVPNEAVREKAIQLARTGTHLTVADGLKIHGALAMRAAGVPAATLEQGARDLVTKAFPELAKDIEIQAKITGQISLTGNAKSYEEKLGVSQLLRRLHGCTCVVNQLKVTPILKEGLSLTMVTSDGLHVVPAEVAMDVPAEARTIHAMPAVRVVTPAKPTPAQMPATDDPLAIPPLPAPVPTQSNPMESPPMPQSLPRALPLIQKRSTPSNTPPVTQGVVTFEDETETAPQEKK
jgi:hypothetical protein